MIESVVLQEWITVAGNSAVAAVDIAQAASGWLDLAWAREAVFTLQVQGKTGTPRVSYETAALRETARFVQIADLSSAVVGTPKIDKIMAYDAPAIPLLRWVRWRVKQDVAAGDFAITFRIVVMAYGR